MQIISIITVLFTAAVAVAQGTPPACALGCLANTTGSGSCALTDTACLCKNSGFIAAQTQCLQGACTNPSDLQQAEAFGQATCQSAGVTLSAALPTGTSPASGAASASAPASSTSAPAKTGSAMSSLSGPIAIFAGFAGIVACALTL